MSINILKYAAVLLASAALTAGCQKFEEPEPFVPAEMEATMTLAEFKALYTGFPMEITDGSIVLEGKVISTDRSGNVYRSLYIEDATAGLEVKIGRTGLYNDYKEGQTIYVKPKYLCIGAYGESVQLGAVSYEERYETAYIDAQALIDRTVFRGAYGEPLTPMDISSASQISDANLCRLVRLRNASYQGSEDGLRTWAVSQDPLTGQEAEYGQQTFRVDGKDVVVRTSGYASFADDEVGLEIGARCNLTGILTKYYDTFQLGLLDLDGVEEL